jgi:hypothetical protein
MYLFEVGGEAQAIPEDLLDFRYRPRDPTSDAPKRRPDERYSVKRTAGEVCSISAYPPMGRGLSPILRSKGFVARD